MRNLDVSIVVCTRDRPKDLDQCLKALSKIDYICSEKLVIDSSTDSSVISRNKSSCARENIGYIYEPIRGLSVARNRGIRESKGQIIAFTDDDCIPDGQWLKKAVRNFSDLRVASCTGRTVSLLSDPLSQIFEEYYGFDRGSKRRMFDREDTVLNFAILAKALPHARKRRITGVAPAPFSVGLGNNMMFRREIFSKIGLFDPKLGAGTPAMAGEECDIFYRILKAGGMIVYEPEAIVFHRHRQTCIDLVDAVYACGFGVAAFLKKYAKLGDLQAAVFYVGRLLNLLYAVNSYRSKNEKDIEYLTSVELKGWINGFITQ